MKRRSFLIGAPLALSACGVGSEVSVWAPDDVVNAAIYRGTGAKSITLMTMRNVSNGYGAHTSLVIDASQRVIFDPAGRFKSPTIPERNDVLFGVSPQIEKYYVSYHARVSFYVETQKVIVSPEVAEQALDLALGWGPVASWRCTLNTSQLLRQLPGFESISSTFMPLKLQDQFAKLPNVVSETFRETDDDDKSIAAAQIDAALALKSGQ